MFFSLQVYFYCQCIFFNSYIIRIITIKARIIIVIVENLKTNFPQALGAILTDIIDSIIAVAKDSNHNNISSISILVI